MLKAYLYTSLPFDTDLLVMFSYKQKFDTVIQTKRHKRPMTATELRFLRCGILKTMHSSPKSMQRINIYVYILVGINTEPDNILH